MSHHDDRRPILSSAVSERGRDPSPLLVSAAEAARLLSISERTLRTRTKDGMIPAVQLGGRVLYSPIALAHWVERRLNHAVGDQ